jgi:hypothetical protein
MYLLQLKSTIFRVTICLVHIYDCLCLMTDVMLVDLFYFYGLQNVIQYDFLLLQSFYMIYLSFQVSNCKTLFQNGRFTFGFESSKFQGRNFYKEGRVIPR